MVKIKNEMMTTFCPMCNDSFILLIHPFLTCSHTLEFLILWLNKHLKCCIFSLKNDLYFYIHFLDRIYEIILTHENLSIFFPSLSAI